MLKKTFDPSLVESKRVRIGALREQQYFLLYYSVGYCCITMAHRRPDAHFHPFAVSSREASDNVRGAQIDLTNTTLAGLQTKVDAVATAANNITLDGSDQA